MTKEQAYTNIQNIFKSFYFDGPLKVQDEAFDYYGKWAGEVGHVERMGCATMPISNQAVEKVFVKSGDFNDIFMTSRDAVKRDMQALKVPKNHDISYFTLILLCDDLDKDQIKKIKACHYKKSYMFTIRGISMLRLIAIDLKNDKLYTNYDAKYFEKKFTSSFLKQN